MLNKKKTSFGTLALFFTLFGMPFSAFASEIQPYQAQQIQPYQSQTIQPYHSTPVQPSGSGINPTQNNSVSNQQQSQDLSLFFHAFGLSVPGAVWTSPGGLDYDILHTSAGTLPSDVLQINNDGTYVWNSAYDSKIYTGKWEKTGESIASGYPIIIRNAEDGRDWKVAKSGPGTWGGKDIVLVDWPGRFRWKNGAILDTPTQSSNTQDGQSSTTDNSLNQDVQSSTNDNSSNQEDSRY